MNIVRVTVRPVAISDTRYAWYIYYDEIPTLTKLAEDVKAFANPSLKPMLLEILEAAKPVNVSSIEKPPHLRHTVKVAETPVGVIEYEKVVVNLLKHYEMEKYRGQLEDLEDVMAPAKE